MRDRLLEKFRPPTTAVLVRSARPRTTAVIAAMAIRVVLHCLVRSTVAMTATCLTCADAQPALETLNAQTSAMDRQVDVLFVLDGSPAMLEERVELVNAFSSFKEALERLAVARLDLHIAVVSSDLGIPPFGAECTTADDGAALRAASCPPNCAAKTSSPTYIVDGHDERGEPVRNYAGTVEAAFGRAVAAIPTTCGVPQPLEAMRRAITVRSPAAGEFIRRDADLAVILVTSRDDCSILDAGKFTNHDGRDDSNSNLGPSDAFRCTEFGVTCDELAVLPRSIGAYRRCEARRGSRYLHYPGDIAKEILVSRGNASRVVVAAIAGDPIPFSVSGAALGGATLNPSCRGAHGTALPAVRLSAFTDALGPRGVWSSICRDNFGSAMEEIAQRITEATAARDD